MDLISKLGIDLKLLIAQFVNFGILIFVLYKFVYHPILDLLEKRSKMIEKSVADAKKSEELLKNIEETQQTKMLETERKIGEMLNQAKNDAEEVKKDILTETQKQSDDLLNRAKLQIMELKEKMIQDARTEVTDYAFQITEKILERKFTKEDQEKLLHAINQEMKTLQ